MVSKVVGYIKSLYAFDEECGVGCYHSSRSPRLRKSLAEVTTGQPFDLVASPTKSERDLSKESNIGGLDGLGF